MSVRKALQGDKMRNIMEEILSAACLSILVLFVFAAFFGVF
jgi:hypothetical protein